MDLLLLLASLAALVLLVVLYRASVEALNRRAEANYGYRPISILTSLLSTAACIVGILGILMGGDNAAVGLVVGSGLFVFLFLRVAVKTSLFTAFLALPLLAIAGMGLVILIVILYLMFGEKKQQPPQAPS